MSDVVLVNDVSKEFRKEREIRTLEHVNLRVRENEILALLGPNGVGKTVLLCCIAGGLFPSKGKISVFDYEPSSKKVHEKIGFLLQESVALNYLTGEENIKYYSRLHGRSTDRWKELVKRFKLKKEDLNRLVKDYSGGMRRKLELVTILNLDVPLYLLDEPAVGLDLSSIQAFHNLLLELKRRGKTIMLSTHNPLNAEIADRIAFMRESENGGEMAIVDEPKNLLGRVPRTVRLAPLSEIPLIVREFVLGNQIYEVGGVGRCFLSSDQEIDNLRDIVKEESPRCKVEEITPTYTDMFNYYSDIWKRTDC